MKQIAALLLAFACLVLPVLWPASTAPYDLTAAAPAGTEVPDAVAVPVIMYHSLLKDPRYHNEFTISPELLESDLNYLNSHGYMTITMSELIDHVKYGAPLPEKPVILTFDDGHYNNYHYAFSLLKQYNMKAVISVVGSYVEQYSQPDADVNHPNYSYLTWDQISEMTESGLVEIQNHSWDLHHNESSGASSASNAARHGVLRLPGETNDHYRQILMTDLHKLQSQLLLHCGLLPNTFTYPFGKFSDSTDDILRELGFEASLSCAERMNYFTPDSTTDDLFGLGRFLRPSGVSSTDYFTRINLL